MMIEAGEGFEGGEGGDQDVVMDDADPEVEFEGQLVLRNPELVVQTWREPLPDPQAGSWRDEAMLQLLGEL